MLAWIIRVNDKRVKKKMSNNSLTFGKILSQKNLHGTNWFMYFLVRIVELHCTEPLSWKSKGQF